MRFHLTRQNAETVVTKNYVVIAAYDEQSLWTFDSSVIRVSHSVRAVLFHSYLCEKMSILSKDIYRLAHN